MRQFSALFLAGAILISVCGCGGGGNGIGTITVSFTTAPGTVAGGATFVFTVTTQNDTSNRGVNFTLALNAPSNGSTTTPCTSSCGTLTGQANVVTEPGPDTFSTTTTINYTAPLLPPTPNSLIITATSASDASITTTSTFTIGAPEVTVRITNKITNIQPGAAPVTLNAQVQFDNANAGVTWTLTAAGAACNPACGSLSNKQPFSVVYTPPSSLPSSPNNTPTITATSVTDATRTDFDDIRIQAPAKPISVSISNPFAQITAGAAGVTINAVVANDIAGQGVTWSLQPAAQAGALSAEQPLSVVYTPPNTAPQPPNNTPTITATSVADPTQSAQFSFTIDPAQAAFVGAYVFLVRGHDGEGNITAAVGSVTSDGAGKITGGEMDINSADATPGFMSPIYGTYDTTISDSTGASIRLQFDSSRVPPESAPLSFEARFTKAASSANSTATNFSEGRILGRSGKWSFEGEIHHQDLQSATVTNLVDKRLELGLRSEGRDHSGLLALGIAIGGSGQISSGSIERLVAFSSDENISYLNEGGRLVEITGGNLGSFDASGRATLLIQFGKSAPARYAVYAISANQLFIIGTYDTQAPQSGEVDVLSPDSE